MASRGKGAAKAADAPQKVAEPSAAGLSDDTPSRLLAMYAEQRAAGRLDLAEFTHAKFERWERYFGFSVEREYAWAASAQHPRGATRSCPGTRSSSAVSCNGGAPSATRPPPQATHGSGAAAAAAAALTMSRPTGAVGRTLRRDDTDPLQSAPLAEDAGDAASLLASLCLSSADLAAIDAAAVEVGPLTNHSVDSCAAAVTAPYATATWRQSPAQCRLKRCRALFCWTAHNIKVLPPADPTSTTSGLTLQVPPAEAPPPPPKRGKEGGKAPPAGSAARHAAVNQVREEQREEDPAKAALAERAADPAGIAALFAALCAAVGVPVLQVSGTLKGTVDQLGKPGSFAPWSWNIVTLEDARGVPAQFLVDVALAACHVGPRTLAASAAAVKQPTNSDASPAAVSSEGPAPHSRATIASADAFAPRFEPWYFLTDPRHFAALHFPDDPSKLLVARHVNRTAWEIYPRLASEFFAHGVRLDSHGRRCVFTAKAVPLHLSFVVEDLVHTELLLQLYRGGALQLSSSLRTDEPIDPRFVWQQREERSGRITFSIMAPDVGLYTLVLFARRVPSKPTTVAQLAAIPFTELTHHQVNVAFVAVNEPMYPLQRVSPSVAKLAAPLGLRVVTTTPQRFVVVPTVPTLRAVAVVNRVWAAASAAPVVQAAAPHEQPSVSAGVTPRGGGGGSGAKPITPADMRTRADAAPAASKPTGSAPPPAVDRVQLHLLEPHPDRATFEGELQLEPGLLEIWGLLCDDATLLKPYALQPADTAGTAAAGGGGGAAASTPQQRLSPTAPDAPAIPSAEVGDAARQPVEGFFPIITDMLAVRRIPPKDHALNDGRPLIQPPLDLAEDLAHTLRLLSCSTENGREWSPASRAFLGAPLRPVGSYFIEHRESERGTTANTHYGIGS